MPLYTTALATALVLILAGAVLVWNASPVAALARAFPRSRRAAILTMGLGTAWALYHVAHLGESDFGNFRNAIFIAFVLLALASFKYVPDFLSVRGTCIVALLLANELLRSSWMQYNQPPFYLLNSFVFAVLIIPSFWLAVAPYRVRDLVQWLFARPNRPRVVGSGIAAYGLVLLGTALSM